MVLLEINQKTREGLIRYLWEVGKTHIVIRPGVCIVDTPSIVKYMVFIKRICRFCWIIQIISRLFG